jgi:hypothetical protein
MLAGNYLWSRWLRGTAIIPAKEFLFNLHRDLVQPLLGPIRSILMTSDLHFKLSYPIFSHSKLTGEFATRLHGLLITGLGSIGGLANHLQNQVPRLRKRIASFGLAARLRRKGNDCVCYGRITTAHGPHPRTWLPGPEANFTTHLPPSRSPVDNSFGRSGVRFPRSSV